MKLLSDCSNIEKGFKIIRTEEGKSIIFYNNEHEIVSNVISIENCVLNGINDGKRCDFLFLFEASKQEYKVLKSNKAFYVELKGTDIDEAYLQLINSVEKTESQIENFEKNAIIVSSREFVPKFDNTDEYDALKKLIRKNVIFKVLNCEIEIITL